MFAGLAEEYPELGVNVVSTEPWIITFDTFMNESESDAIFNAVGDSFTRSTDTGSYNKFGEAEKVVSQGRTSENAWCRAGCDDQPLVRSVIERIEKVTQVPYGNYEQFQVLRYLPGQYYRTHHDYGVSQKSLACGPRVLTFFLYLSDVEEGGETDFPRLDIRVPPKKGKALLWPSVMSEDLLQQAREPSHRWMPRWSSSHCTPHYPPAGQQDIPPSAACGQRHEGCGECVDPHVRPVCVTCSEAACLTLSAHVHAGTISMSPTSGAARVLSTSGWQIPIPPS